MTQSSRPNADHSTNGYVDAGPYSRDQWAKKLIIEYVGDAVTTRGPFAKYLNRLEVTNPAGVTIQVDTGAGYVNGTLLDNTVAVTFTPDTPAIAARIDKVVMCLNNTNTAYDGTPSAVILDFPTDLTDYEGAASIPAYSARLAILRGDDATGAATALIQTTDYYMVELARFTISNVPAVSALTDNRDYVDALTRYIFVPCFYGRNITDNVDMLPEAYLIGGSPSGSPVIWMDDNKTTSCWARTQFPADYIDTMTVKGVIINTSISGDLNGELRWRAGGCGELYNVVNDRTNTVTETIDPTNLHYSCHFELAITGVTPDQVLTLQFDRFGASGDDTINADVAFTGFLIEYLGVR